MAWGREISRAAVLVACSAMLVLPAAAAADGPPQVLASWVTDVTATGANLRAEVNPNGPFTKYRFQYISEAAYQANLAAAREGFQGAAQAPPSGEADLGPGTTPLKPAQHVGGLGQATSYRYRIVAKNSIDTTIGADHVFTTEEPQQVFALPDDRAWEMVSPVDKNGGAIATPGSLFGGGDFQAAAAGSAVTYGSATAFGEAASAPPASQYVSRRTGSGWATENVSAPLDSGAYGDEPDGAPYRVFSADLSRGLLFGGLACRGGLPPCSAPNPTLPGSGAPPGYMAYYLRDGASGAFASLLGAGDVAHSAVAPGGFEVTLAAASPDLAHIVLSSCAKLTADAIEVPGEPGRCDPGKPNLYEWSASGLRAVNLLPGQSASTPGAVIGASIGAISDGGSRIYWSSAGNLYLREGAQTIALDESGGATFQTATPGGSVAFFTTADGHLRRFTTTGGTSTDLTPGGGVIGVLGASPDGEYVYFQDAAGLRVWHGGATATIAPGADAADSSDYPPATATARVSANGANLAFLSSAELTAFDNTDAASGEPDAELYLYGPAAGGVGSPPLCVSCNPTGERPLGPASIPGAQVNGSGRAYRPRLLSADGSRLLFETRDSLVSLDLNSQPDVYEWEAAGRDDCGRPRGCVSLISSGRNPSGARFVDSSADGDDVFFVTDESLIDADPGSVDLYDARVGGGLPEPPRGSICVGDSCQSLPEEPRDPTPSTLVPNSGNPAKRFVKEGRPRKRHRHHRHRHHRRGGRHRGHHGGRR